MMKNNKKKLFEEDLYAPVKDYLEEKGYTVKAEVGHCDVTAIIDDVLLVVEMKTTLNLDVILQAALRQRIADRVYIAVPKKGKVLFTKRWQNICYLLRRLEIGLLLVSIRGKSSFVEEVLIPEPFSRERSKGHSKKKRNDVVREFNERYGDFNTGGSTRKKLVTSYKEKAIHIAALLKKHGPLSIKRLKEMGTDIKKTSTILQNNHYSWFERVGRGVYALTGKGDKELDKHREIVSFYLNSK